MTRIELEKKNKQELKTICKDMGIHYYHGKSILKKDEMIDEICRCLEKQDDANDINKRIAETCYNEKCTNKYADESKLERVVTAPIGTLLAFYEPGTTKLNTAKITNRNKSKKLIKCETQYGREFIVSFESIVWVKTGSRWPKGIYNILKKKKVEENEREKVCHE